MFSHFCQVGDSKEVNCSHSFSLSQKLRHINIELGVLSSELMLCLQDYPTCKKYQNFPEILISWTLISISHLQDVGSTLDFTD